jgi:hypothetical protein
VCFAGVDPNECGAGGEVCLHCESRGLACVGQQCAQEGCGPQSCTGCCFGNQCTSGDATNACGEKGQQCINCGAIGESCLPVAGGGICAGPPNCSTSNCSGCCLGNTCVTGNSSTACGFGGQQCQDCLNFGASCQFQQCIGTFCGPQNCGGCCQGSVCVSGTDPFACGFGGQQCNNCQSFGESCVSGACFGQTTCGPQNCPGCCVGNLCLPGNNDPLRCGFGGVTCQDCAALGEACNVGTCTGQSTCGTQSCSGCCQGNSCLVGNTSFACGFGGVLCENCQAFGDTCANQQCMPQPTCGPQNCKGCCVGNTCIDGSENTTCGSGGATCVDCVPSGATCLNQACVSNNQCNPKTCAGCCEGNACVAGDVNVACGQAGSPCQDCATLNETCQNQACVAATLCGPQNCGGCCEGNTCVFGDGSNACGFGGAQCQDCTALGETCTNSQCMSACNSINCAGCCDAQQVCQPGFLDTQCGGQGAACVNCTALSPPSTCDGAVTPAVCKGQETQCPSPYPGCGAAPTPSPVPQFACSPGDLQNARVACSGGAYTTACTNFFNVEFQQNGACGSCLQQFDYDFADNQGVFTCVAPFVPAGCNQSTACETDCQFQSCGSCPDITTYDQCRSTVQAGQCATYVQAAQCDQPALKGVGSFCNPGLYTDFGAWLQAVGMHYCASGIVVDGGVPVDAAGQ